ncbi:XkdX family protein [Ligilactobacillus salivarius]|nr:XkdX family protein [Ligilactobacillus salivarius]MBZ4031485.1 XkdX family protein [Ligilactobacillus salivarius]
MQYSYEFVKEFYDLGLFSKKDIELLVEVGQFSKENYNKIFNL